MSSENNNYKKIHDELVDLCFQKMLENYISENWELYEFWSSQYGKLILNYK